MFIFILNHKFAIMKTTVNDRVVWIDMAKGYGIILVIIGHWDIPYITDFLYAFHIPLFFFLSGIFFSLKNDFVSFMRNKIHHIVIPYFCLGISVIIANLIFSRGLHFRITDMVEEFVCLVVQERYTTLWFFACLLMVNLLMYPMIRYIRNRKICDLCCFGLCICGIVLWRNGAIVLPWNIDAALVMLPFFYIGFRLKYFITSPKIVINKIKCFHNFHNIIIVFFLGVLVWIFNLMNMLLTGERVDVFYSNLTMEFLTLPTAIIGIVMIVLLSKNTKNSVIRYIGENSILYFAWHQTIVLPLLCRIYWKVGLFDGLFIEMNMLKWISVIVTIIIITLLNEVVKHSKLKFVLGH